MPSNINPTLTPTKSLSNFRFWCQKVLPLVYDDSLSYYEVLGKMVVQLNDVIDDVNADIENVDTLKEAFLALQTYVNEFFADIDQLASYAERAEAAQTAANQSAINASESATNASASSLAAMNARDAAVTAKNTAEASASTASTAATNANTKASEAAQSAITAQTAQASASQSATLAATDRSSAQTAASTATAKASEASTSASNAAQRAEDAEDAAASVEASSQQIATNTNDIRDLKETVSQIENVSGSILKTIENVPIASFDDGTDSAVKQLVVNIEPVQTGTGDPSPDNVRPITGWTGAKVTRMGKNLLDSNGLRDSFTQNGLTFTKVSGTHYKVNGTSTGMGWVSLQNAGSPEISVKLPLGTYTMSCSTNKFNCYIMRDEFFTDYVNATVKVTSTGKPVYAVRLLFESNVSFSNEDLYIQLESGSSATDYEEPKGNQISITFPSEAGTVYGGTLTINEDGSGELVVDRGSITPVVDVLQSINSYGIANFSFHITIPASDNYTKKGKAISNVLKTQRSAIADTTEPGIMIANRLGGFVRLNSADADSIAKANEWIENNNLIIVYFLDTPITYTLTADEIHTLLGTNNIWADTGNINLLKYYADSETYIDEQLTIVKALIAPVLTDMIADTALVINDFRIVNNILYRVTTPIASGGTLTVGTNVVATTLAEVIKPLLT